MATDRDARAVVTAVRSERDRGERGMALRERRAETGAVVPALIAEEEWEADEEDAGDTGAVWQSETGAEVKLGDGRDLLSWTSEGKDNEGNNEGDDEESLGGRLYPESAFAGQGKQSGLQRAGLRRVGWRQFCAWAFALMLLAAGYLSALAVNGLRGAGGSSEDGRDAVAAGGGSTAVNRGHETVSHGMEETSKPSAQNQIIIDIHGDVRHPGVYHVAAGGRVADAVRAAGGYRHAADANLVNAAEVLDDGEEVVIPNAAKAVSGVIGPGTGGGASGGVLAGAANGSASDTQRSSGGVGGSSEGTGASKKGESSASGTAATAAGSGGSGTRIDLNTADAATLETLPGIGPTRATAIVNYRKQHGRFQSVADLEAVPGIGPATLQRLSPYLYVGGTGD
jgi:competence protein ComEA